MNYDCLYSSSLPLPPVASFGEGWGAVTPQGKRKKKKKKKVLKKRKKRKKEKKRKKRKKGTMNNNNILKIIQTEASSGDIEPPLGAPRKYHRKRSLEFCLNVKLVHVGVLFFPHFSIVRWH